tara:strand:- start:545 stop:754 length:210 start_codon:yes stop_codon:yes gene_type:complete
MKQEDKNKIKEYSKQTPLYLSRRKFDASGALTEVQCSSCKEFKALDEYAKNRTQIDGLEHKCNTCKASK